MQHYHLHLRKLFWCIRGLFIFCNAVVIFVHCDSVSPPSPQALRVLLDRVTIFTFSSFFDYWMRSVCVPLSEIDFQWFYCLGLFSLIIYYLNFRFRFSNVVLFVKSIPFYINVKYFTMQRSLHLLHLFILFLLLENSHLCSNHF